MTHWSGPAVTRALGIVPTIVLLAACNPSASPAPTVAPAAPAAAPAKRAADGAAKPAEAAKPAAAARPDMAALVEGAKKEGQISFIGTNLRDQSTVDALMAVFRKKYGLPDSFSFSATHKVTGEIAATVDTELQAKKVTYDIVSFSGMPWWQDKIKQGAVMAFDAPEYAGYDAAEKLNLNLKPYLVSDGVTCVPIWNTKKLPTVEIKSWNDIFKYDLKGKVATASGDTGTTLPALTIGLVKVARRPSRSGSTPKASSPAGAT
ncbi:MAG: hypothetical protein IT307_00805 [Chloroflexi bacterium]|nr:hypothetical protein [Chloroflexota bacterium]